MHHGSKNFEIAAPRSRFYKGGFGRLFPDLPPWKPALESDTQAELEAHMMEVAERLMTDDGGADKDSALPSGYVYFGQFVDHDITLDITPLSDAEADPNRLDNFRTPRLDLDCVYGLGPDAQPYLYDKAKGFNGKLRVDHIAETGFLDLPRLSRRRGTQQTAIIGDPRNDENALVAQIQLAWILAHNTLVDEANAQGLTGHAAFERARKSLKWLYQWIVWHDYVSRICSPDIHAHALKRVSSPGGRHSWELGYKDVYNWKSSPFMPVEFSVAAYRYGHSLVRTEYQTNIIHGFPNFTQTFSADGDNLSGFRSLDVDRVVQWDWFLQMTSSAPGIFPQFARAFDTKLAQALSHLPEDADAPGNPMKILNVLAARNLVRGVRMELPSGVDVAKLLNVEPIKLADDEPEALWYYILKEAETASADNPCGGDGMHLGCVGSIIVASTFAGLLKGDPLSFVNLQPGWKPDDDELLQAINARRTEAGTDLLTEDAKDADNPWTLASIIRLSGLPIDADMVNALGQMQNVA